MTELYFILVEPAVPENIGAAARAIKTMGFDRLRLVNPQNYPNDKAFHVAHGSRAVLEQAEIFPTLKEALQDISFSVATSAKRRSVRFDGHHAATLPALLEAKKHAVKRAAIVFGREESGLTNSEIGFCDLLSYIPMKGKYPSLNLSQAVMLYAYLLSPFSAPRSKSQKNVPAGKYERMTSLAHRTLEGIRLKRDSNVYSRIFERLALLGDDDVNLVLSFLDKLAKTRAG